MKKIVQRVKNLGVIKREYLEEVVRSLSLSPVLTAFFNLFIIFLVMVKRTVKRIVRKSPDLSTTVTDFTGKGKIVDLNRPATIPEKIRILLIVEESIPHCFRYRVKQKTEQFDFIGWECEWVSWKDHKEAEQKIHFYHVIIFYRVPGFKSVMHLIDLAAALNKTVIYDVDDLIFDPDIMKQYSSGLKHLTSDIQRELIKGAEFYNKAIEQCPYIIGSTPSLCNVLASYDARIFLHRNGLDSENIPFIQPDSDKNVNPDSDKRVNENKYITIIYGSGTKTHDADFKMITPAVLRIMGSYENVRLVIVGSLCISDEFDNFGERVIKIPAMGNQSYMELLKNAHISIAPLEQGIFMDCKSEIKWLEAAVFRVPSVVSNTATFREIIDDGKNGFLASSPDQWYDRLSMLLRDRCLRESIGKNALECAIKNYTPNHLSLNLDKIIKTAVDETFEIRKVKRKKIVFVNVLYPPYALGGATVVVKKHVDIFAEKYGAEFDVSVFTTVPDADNHEIIEYEHEGIHVFGVGVPHGPDLDWRYKDETMYDIFMDYIKVKEPDFIHFHSIQRLTGSILEAADDSKIPFAVTLHDSWWLCDRQFMINAQGEDCGQFRVDPCICSGCVDDIDGSIKRRTYLETQLKKADCLFAVSMYQKQLYQSNGFTNIALNLNGIFVDDKYDKDQYMAGKTENGKIVIGYAGGVCVHKGYYLLKEAALQSNLHNIEFVVIDFTYKNGMITKEKWKDADVKKIPGFPFSQMHRFYSSIDVLVVPSLWRESFGLTVREALACGKWVIASDAGALAEDIADGINGFVFHKGDKQGLSAILEKIDKTSQLYKSRNKLGIVKVRKIEEQADELVPYYKTAIRRNMTAL